MGNVGGSHPHAGVRGSTWQKIPRFVLLVGLVTLTAYLSWFDDAPVVAIFDPTTEAVRNLRFAVVGYSNTVYPFTYVGVALSVVGCSHLIYRAERPARWRAVAARIGLGVANIESVGMINVHEQGFVAVNYLSPHSRPDRTPMIPTYWGSAGAVAGTVTVLTILSWSQVRNRPSVVLLAGVFALGSLVWFASGYWPPPSGKAVGYWMNEWTRAASQLILVAALAPSDSVRFLVDRAYKGRAAAASGGKEVPAPDPSAASPSARTPALLAPDAPGSGPRAPGGAAVRRTTGAPTECRATFGQSRKVSPAPEGPTSGPRTVREVHPDGVATGGGVGALAGRERR
ncbi:MAG: hypothetical protein WBE40_03255 [Thermoplasmata archaeon]